MSDSEIAGNDQMPADSWIVEPADIAHDLEGLLDVHGDTTTQRWTAQMFQEEAGRDVSHIFVIRGSGSPLVGYCAVWVIVDELHINSLAVAPRWRRRGAGRALLGYTLTIAAHLGARRATLEVRGSNAAARRLYEQAGFRIEGIRKRYYSNPVEDALVLWSDSLGSLETTSTV